MADSDWSIRHCYDVANYELIKQLIAARDLYCHESGRRFLDSAIEAMKLFHSQAHVIMTMPGSYLIRDMEKVRAYGEMLVKQSEKTIAFLEKEAQAEHGRYSEKMKLVFVKHICENKNNFDTTYARWFLHLSDIDKLKAECAYKAALEYIEATNNEK